MGVTTAAAMTVALLFLSTAPPLAAAKTYGPGKQPGKDGQTESCPRGTYKGYSGAYKCTKCKAGSIAPTAGRRDCFPCSPAAQKTSNSARTFCVFRNVYNPGYQPGSNGHPEPCPKGTYKGYKGSYACTKCASGSIAPSTGRRSCIKCHPSKEKTSNSGRTFCVYRPGFSAPKPTPKPTTGSRNPTIRADSTIYRPSRSCQPDVGGATRCGIPVGYRYRGGRTGAVSLPRTYKYKAVPYMILLHGSGIDGWEMIDTFKNSANKWQYGIVAPDSRYDLYWDVPNAAAEGNLDMTDGPESTHDFEHIQGCWDRVMKMPGVKVNRKYIMIVGNSRAAFAAPAFGSRSTIGINSALLIHAAMNPYQMGPRTFPIYWSTGYSDPLYGPTVANKLRPQFKAVRPDFPITYRVWQGSHTIRNYTELDNWSEWWLRPSTRSAPAPPLRG